MEGSVMWEDKVQCYMCEHVLMKPITLYANQKYL